MCSIIGYWPVNPTAETQAAFGRLLYEGRVRGMHAYGVGADNMVFRSFDLQKVIDHFDPSKPSVAHCRYSTSGDYTEMRNNQPIMAVGTGMILAFNGVIHMGTKEEFEAAFGVKCDSDNDGEVFLRLLHQGKDPAEIIRSFSGSFAGVWLRNGRLFAGRNERRPLWTTLAYGARWFTSTRDLFVRAEFEPEKSNTGAWGRPVLEDVTPQSYGFREVEPVTQNTFGVWECP